MEGVALGSTWAAFPLVGSSPSCAMFPRLRWESVLGHQLGGARPHDRSIGTGVLFKVFEAFKELYWGGRGTYRGRWKLCWNGVVVELFFIACRSCWFLTTKIVLFLRS